MMINLNLINNEKKKKISRDIHCIMIINGLAMLGLTIGIISILLYASNSYLGHKIDEMEKIGSKTSINSEIVAINQEMQHIDAVQKNFTKWSRVITNLMSIIPEGNTLHRANLDKKNNKIVINGLSKTRDTFLKLKEALEKSDLITDLNSPISNILYQTDINFTLEAKLNLQ
ncbi:hypothetical protein COV56_01580 [Candidatus Kuenenbacteria bacterium CG11_big_fil_rev_8_21_14_0_20_37_9]|uniref:PilN domain-containing protein n=2 Tax=Candidatus Kueneniibacteriota TaxID=1752740 RepID=A0A2M6XSK5_9BACT|nr:MAG: hypothetical protein AUJ29_02520 [Candidatus Kuenenbacteria bacterium CG1_02_38_13]PIR05652.1 MAG: hypothetical protein COV56_01580 [Candidatus Kuenenbacteria bacterium CG11_big_fil_rev_8_21_14_0_20_37_9]PIU10623.1 MAG: hypothetical protein COT27_02020 [Candidatus Kuenenbacteria bacterium CG08_land_8_20_14_0_20_37_23]